MLPALLLVLLPASPSRASVAVQFSGGGVYNVPAPLSIRQDGRAVLERDAAFDTRGFEPPIYYMARAGRWEGDAAWELEFVHDKLYLVDAPPDAAFSVSHGLNLLLVNRAGRARGRLWRAGAGPVVAHPESEVRGRRHEGGGLGGGYYLSGAGMQVGLEKRVRFRRLFFSLEAKATLSWVRVPVAGGHATLWNPALHGLLGLGCEL